MRTIAGGITLPVEVNGNAATFILDTGAERSMVTPEAVQRLGLARDQWVGTTMSGVGGIDRLANASPRSLSLGGIKLVRRTLNHDNSLTVGLLPGQGATGIDGLLGRDYLAPFDLDLDMPAHRLTLYTIRDCAGRFLPWTGHYASIPISTPAREAIVVPVLIDDKPLRAILDTGASSSLLAAPGMFRLGLSQQKLMGDPAGQISGMGLRTIMAHRHRFDTLTVGNQTTPSPSLWVEPVRLAPISDMLLGADWLAGKRVWISLATKQLFVAE